MTSQIPPEQAIREQAAEWAVLRSAGALSPEQEQALARWCAADPRHVQALAFAEATWADLGRIGEMPAPVPVAKPQVLPGVPLGGRRRRSRLRWLASAAAMALVAVVGVVQGPDLALTLRADYLTAKGEVRSVTLPDGSRVDLDSHSGITLAFTDRERRVRLLRGDAIFSAAPVSAQEPRPFVVEYAGASSKALGTQFVVGAEGQGGWLGMLEHSVALNLHEPPRSGESSRIVEEGQSVRFDGDTGIRLWPERDARRATGWQRGMLVFEREPLATVVEQLNRYREGRIVITDSALAKREVSGVFRLDNLDQALGMLTDELKVSRMDLAGVTFVY